MARAATIDDVYKLLGIQDLDAYGGDGPETIRLVTVPLERIEIPPFQRDEKAKEIATIASEYDRTAYAFPIIALWNDRLLCLDGQQRLAAMTKMHGLKGVLVAVLLVENIATRERLAEVFLRINRDRRLLAPFEKYIAALASHDRGTVDIKHALEESGDVIGKSATPNRIPAGAAIQIHSMPNGPDLLRRVLFVKNQAWGDKPSREANESKTLLGLASFIRRHWEKVDDQHLITVLRKHHPGYILSAIAGSPAKLTYADYLLEQYNRGVRGKGRL